MSTGLQSLCLVHKEVGSKNDTITDDVHLAALEDTRGNATENILLTLEFESVTGIGSTLKTSNDIITRGQYIDHLSFSFIAPLQSEQDVTFTFVPFLCSFLFCFFSVRF